MTHARILIVEDDFLIRMTLAEILGESGYAIVEAASGEEAVAAVQTDPEIALAIMDLKLGAGMDGGRAAAAIREGRPGFPILFVTGNPDAAPATAPQDGVLAKPYLPSEAVALTKTLLRRAYGDTASRA